MKFSKTNSENGPSGWLALTLLAAVLAALFWRSFLPDFVHFSNDGPLGQQATASASLPGNFTGAWSDSNIIGASGGAWPMNFSVLLRWVLGPVGFAKFFTPVALFIVGLGAWTFFRQIKLSPLAAMLGALAAMLNTTFFSNACWGTAAQQIALGMDFLALALVVANTGETSWFIRWTRLALAGLCVGVNVMEAADVGALFSILIAAFVFFATLTDGSGLAAIRAARGIGRVMVVAAFAGFISFQSLLSLVGTNIQGVAGTAQDAETKAQHWDWATQWSLPKKETFSIFIPGLFGYKMDTPNYMEPALRDFYKGGAYWGGIGREPANDRFFDSGGKGAPPDPGGMRQTGSNYFCGILVTLVAMWTVAQSFRRKNSPFTSSQKKFIWFWTAVLFACLLFAWGRFAPFYALLYKLPYFSTIRNPDKFLVFLSCAMVILFAYGIHALSVRCLAIPVMKSAGPFAQLKIWWSKAGGFDRKWTFACATIAGVSLIGWFIYNSEKSNLISYLQMVQSPGDPNEIAAFSISQVGWFVLLFTAASGLLVLVISGVFAGKRAKTGGFLLGLFLVIDMGRADLPFIIHWDYKQKYEVGSLNPVESFLKEKPYEHRVAILPFEPREQLRSYDNAFFGNGIYRIEWTQHHFLYYNIQSLDLIQMAREPADLKDYSDALSPRTEAEAPLFARHWELTNTRYLLGAAGFLDAINQQLDPAQRRFRIVQRFDLVAKPGITQPTGLEELTAATSPDGDLAIFEFTGALPRAKLYSNWQVSTNDTANLQTLADPNFDPAKTVLISTPQKDLPAVATNENSGTVDFKSYSPKKIIFDANATAPSVLLLNDKYDPNWRVTVDGKPADLLRCNFIMRGVYLAPGDHTVEFNFTLPNKPLYVTLAAIATGICLLGILIFLQRRERTREI
jgi:hypothetical protein